VQRAALALCLAAFTYPTRTNPFVRMRTIVAFLAISFLLFFATALPTQANDTDDLFVVVTSDDAQTQMMAMVLATQSMRQGATVRVLLCGPGGRLAIADESFPTFEPAGRSPQELLRGLMAEEQVVEVCAIFLPNTEFGQEDLIDGIGTAMPPAIAEHMLRPDVRYFTF